MQNFSSLKTPCYVIDETKLINNLEILHGVEERTGTKILLAQKDIFRERLAAVFLRRVSDMRKWVKKIMFFLPPIAKKK